MLLVDDSVSQVQEAEDIFHKQAELEAIPQAQINAEVHTHTHLNIGGNAIDGMPAISTEANPIDWSAVEASQPSASSPVYVSSPLHNAIGQTQPQSTESTTTTASDWKGSIFGKKTFNRFASFVTSGAEDYVLSDADPSEDERSKSIARKVSGGKPVATLPPPLTEVAEEDEGVTPAMKLIMPVRSISAV